ncbi:hypothetical protein Acry_0780 [Acidiphilium cryptum JF-5]|uniref:Uncharacterized protein n=1 Tax=Acidiphilium cryptum (strain JF-5) TaxID=349163 RepID=A5FWL8_ACICJ|nr:hypothetical protein Acry_0780 [Acidiphilium cryptum JF-5]
MHFGGPKYQSICNNKAYRNYINLRFSEEIIRYSPDKIESKLPLEVDAVISTLKHKVSFLESEVTRLRRTLAKLSPVSVVEITSHSERHLSDSSPQMPTLSPLESISKQERQDLKVFLEAAYDLGFDVAADGRLVTRQGLTVIGDAGHALLRRLTA